MVLFTEVLYLLPKSRIRPAVGTEHIYVLYVLQTKNPKDKYMRVYQSSPPLLPPSPFLPYDDHHQL